MSQMSKMTSALALAAVVGFVFLNASVSFVAPGVPKGAPAETFSTAFEAAETESRGIRDMSTSVPMYGMVLLAAGIMVHGRTSKVARKALHGIKFPYSMQKDAHADLEFLNDVGYLPDGTPMNKAGNCINHPETIQPDPHSPGSPLPRAEFTNSIGYLPDGTPLNAAGNALNHPETMQPDMRTPGSPLPTSVYAADVGFLVDGTDLATAGNNSVKGLPVAPMTAPPVPPPMYVVEEPVAAAFVGAFAQAPTPSASSPTTLRNPAGFAYAAQKDSYADLNFGNDVGYLPDGTPMNRAGNAINHPENIQPDPHAPGSPLPRAIFVNDVGYLPDGTPLNAAGNAINHP
ncbi:Ribulose bisphosphate carboxylase, partial [Durusdinium trenchii]